MLPKNLKVNNHFNYYKLMKMIFVLVNCLWKFSLSDESLPPELNE